MLSRLFGCLKMIQCKAKSCIKLIQCRAVNGVTLYQNDTTSRKFSSSALYQNETDLLYIARRPRKLSGLFPAKRKAVIVRLSHICAAVSFQEARCDQFFNAASERRWRNPASFSGAEGESEVAFPPALQRHAKIQMLCACAQCLEMRAKKQ